LGGCSWYDLSMDESVTHHHLRRHTKKIMLFILISILILAAGEYYLYRQQLHIKNMVSEGLFQLKQQINMGNQQQLKKIEEMNKPTLSLPVKK